jgi:hypothetical protein
MKKHCCSTDSWAAVAQNIVRKLSATEVVRLGMCLIVSAALAVVVLLLMRGQ